MSTAIEPAPLEWQALWDAMEAEYYALRVTWQPTTEEMYYEMLGVLPPEAQAGGAFLVGEPWCHDGNGHAVHACFRHGPGYKKYAACYLTRLQFQSLFCGK